MIFKIAIIFLYFLPGYILCLVLNYRPSRVSWIEFVVVGSFVSITLETVVAIAQTAVFGQVTLRIILSSVYLTNFLVLLTAFLSVLSVILRKQHA